MSEENALKVILLGEMMVGKTNLINRLMGMNSTKMNQQHRLHLFAWKTLQLKEINILFKYGIQLAKRNCDN